MKKRTYCFISAGEHSGDLLAAELFNHLRAHLPKLHGFGVTGEAMRQAGIRTVATTDDFSFMGFAEIIRRLPDLIVLEKEILASVDRFKPEVAILVDFPGFHFRLAEQLKLRGIKVIQYVAPKLWAWGESRVERLRRDFHMVLGILPFEAEFFRSRHVNYVYVGNPHRDRCDKILVERSHFGFSREQKIVACLPGSRVDELRLMLPIILEIVYEIRKREPDVEFVIPMATNLGIDGYRQAISRFSPDAALIEDRTTGSSRWLWNGIRLFPGMSLELMSLADAAIVTSGTATLECALVGTPLTVVYAMSPMTYDVARKKVTISEFSLVNLIAGKSLVSEHIQQIEPKKVSAEIIDLISSSSLRARQMKDNFSSLRRDLAGHAAACAASIVATEISGVQNSR